MMASSSRLPRWRVVADTAWAEQLSSPMYGVDVVLSARAHGSNMYTYIVEARLRSTSTVDM